MNEDTKQQTMAETSDDQLPLDAEGDVTLPIQEALTGQYYEEAPWRSKKRLMEYYRRRSLTTKEIGNRLGCSRKTIEKWVKKHDITRVWNDREKLEELRAKGFSLSEIARRYNTTQATISNHMNDFGMETSRPDPEGPWTEKETLERLYWSEGLDMDEIGSRLGCDRQTIQDWMSRHGVETRSIIKQPIPELQDEEWLRKQYCSKRRSTYDIADELDCVPSTVYDYLEQHDIETRPVGMHWGEMNHQWKGGVSRSYGPTWKGQRNRARDRDNHCCRRCGVEQSKHIEEYDERLHVHHIEPFRNFEDKRKAHRLENLATLCRPCHRMLEGLPSGIQQGEVA